MFRKILISLILTVSLCLCGCGITININNNGTEAVTEESSTKKVEEQTTKKAETTQAEETTTEMNGAPDEIACYALAGTFQNASQKARGDFGTSTLEFKDGGTFTMTDVEGMGATEINGLVSQMGDVLVFSDFDCVPYNSRGEEVHNFEFHIIDDDTLELMTTLGGCKKGDCFTRDGNIPSDFESQYAAKIYRQFTHTPIDGVAEEYIPRIELYDDGTFIFTENLYAGMGEYRGTYDVSDMRYTLSVAENNLQGFAGDDVQEIILDCLDNGGVVLRTDLCMSRDGDTFVE